MSTDNEWVHRVDQLRQYVSDQYDPDLGTPADFVELAKESGEYDNDDLAVILREAEWLAERQAQRRTAVLDNSN